MEGESKNSLLFLRLLWELVQRHPGAKVIHVILDNYSIHDTRQVEASLKTPEGRRIRLHFLPPYCPDHNKVERTWQDLHANVTRNHCCPDTASLMREVRASSARSSRTSSKPLTRTPTCGQRRPHPHWLELPGYVRLSRN